MFFDTRACRDLLDQFEYESDDRKPPDSQRRARFKAGWRDAAERGRIYGPKSLQALTWHNLGNRLGEHFGERSADEIDEAFECFSDAFRRDGDT